MKYTSSIFTLLLVLAFTLPASAEGGKWHERRNMMFKNLDLDDDQKEKLKEVRSRFRPQMKTFRKKRRELRKSMHKAMESDTSESDLRSMHKEVSDNQRISGDLRFEKMIEIRRVLKPDQRAKFFEMKREMRKKRRDR